HRYCAYMAPPATATTLPSRAWAASDAPAATTVPAPSFPTGRDCPTRAGPTRPAAGGSGAVTTGRSAVPAAVAWVMSAPASSSPRADGVVGAAALATVTWRR